MTRVVQEGSKVFIPNIPRISWDSGEMCEFASAMVRCVSCLGKQISYHSVMGHSGVAFRFVLNRNIWDPKSYRIRNFTQNPNEPIHRACVAAGYAIDVFERGEFTEDRRRITNCIDKGIPVLAFGVVGPSDCVLICGYDGDVLLGWSTFQDIPDDHDIPHDILGYFRKPGWHENTRGYLILGSQSDSTQHRRIYLDALELAYRVIETPVLGDRICGLNALERWSQIISDDAHFSVDEEKMRWRYLCFTLATTMLIDQHSVVPFLEEVSSAIPEIRKQLMPVSEYYRLNSKLIEQARNLIADDFSPNAINQFNSSNARKEYAELIHEICMNTRMAAYGIRTGIDCIIDVD
jgi:hypothetical protein